MRKNIIKLSICIVLTVIIGVIGINIVTVDGNVYKTIENNSSDEAYKIKEYNYKYASETTSFKNSITYIGNYKITIKSQNYGHPSNGSIFSTSTQVNGGVIFIDYYFYNSSIEQDYKNLSELKEIKINKKLNYIIDNDENIAILLYKNDENSYMKIIIEGGNKDSGDSTQKVEITKSLLKNKKLKKEIKFEIEKEE